MRAWIFTRQNRGIRGFDGHDFDILLLAQVLSNAADGPARSDASNEYVDFAFRIPPNFRTRKEVMRRGIVFVFKLIRHKPIGMLLF